MVRYHNADNSSSSKWLGFAWAIMLLAIVPLKDANTVNAEIEYNHARQLLVRGYLAQSQKEAELGYQHFQTFNLKWATKFHLLEAEIMARRGMYQDAQQIVVSQYISPDDLEERIQKLTLEGINLNALERLPEADRALREANRLCVDTAYSPCGSMLLARGVLAVEQQRPFEARAFFLQGVDFAHSHSDRWMEATAFLNLGWSYLQNEHYDESLHWFEEANEIADKSHFEDLVQRALGNLGWAYFGLGDSDRALELFRDAENRATAIGNAGNQIKWLKTSAYVYRDYGQLIQAQETFRQALNLAAQINAKQDILDTLEDLAHISVEIGDLNAASTYIERVAPLAQASGKSLDISYVSLAQGKLAAARREDAKAEELFRGVERNPASQVSMKFGAEHELARLFEAEGRAADAQRMYETALNTFEGARDELKSDDSKLPFLANAVRIYDDYIHFLVTQGKVEEALRTADQSRAKTLAQGFGATDSQKNVRPEMVSPRTVARKSGATLLFYWLGEKQSYLWVITPQKTEIFPLPAQKEIAPLVERYRKVLLLGAQDPLDSGNATGQQLYSMLVGPAAGVIRPKVPVMVLTDGPLSELNFETLIVPANGPNTSAHYWIDDASVMAAPSLAMLAAAKPWHETARNMLLLGDPVSPAEDYPELPFASMEMKQIERHFASSDEMIFARGQATPAAYLANDPRRFSYIHFVSHGIASRTDPLDSAIILSRTSRDTSATAGAADSFKLYAREVMKHPIDARLVTISACYGSGSRTYRGEGLVGLSWAFLRAGAHNVIGALWEASDESSPKLMDSLYEGLQEGKQPDAALRNAKLALLHSPGKFHKAYYWAPYQIYTRL